MSTDAGSETSSLSAELEAAAKLLKKHHAENLLVPEDSKAEAKTEEKSTPTEKKGRKAKAPKKVAAAAAPVEKPKVKKAKAAKAEPKKRSGTTGQSGPHIDALSWNDLNKKERLLVGCFDLEGDREVRTIDALAEAAFKGKAKNLAQANSWARNSLRRLMRSGKWLEKVEPGKYRLTAYARKSLSAKED